ncbi:unnamed protein product [Gongylonema pulchrum]|uniref:Uncharacterized protein n=1 Tax=Gongylonema pulchrum TaxID=637853 RepID=A0A183DIC6_9BILA|nr:unnamed protein product [Gongylonema pulchrum]
MNESVIACMFTSNESLHEADGTFSRANDFDGCPQRRAQSVRFLLNEYIIATYDDDNDKFSKGNDNSGNKDKVMKKL